jgi:KDO2-lipid IV(A) lauroyltransferase
MMKDLRYRVEYALVRIAGAFLRLMSIDMAGSLTGWAVGWVAPHTSLHRRAMANLQTAFPQWTDAERRHVAAAMWRNTGRTIAETMLLDRILADPSRLIVDDREAVSALLERSGAALGLTLHLGNWEIAGIACGLYGARLAGVYRPLRNPYLDRYLRRTRTPFYPAGLFFKGKSGGTLAIGGAGLAAIKLLREGGHLGMVCDQVDDSGLFTVPFFGQDATFTPAPALIARHVGARVWVGCCQRIGNRSQFRMDIRELPVTRTEDRTADLRLLTAAMARQFELWIRETPDQWMWWQRQTIAG